MQDPVPVITSEQAAEIEQPSVSREIPASEISQASAEPNGESETPASSKEIANAEVPVETTIDSEQSDDSEVENTAMGTEASQAISSSDEKFVSAWNTMFELLFREIATIYYPLKGVIPSIENNIIHVKVKNEMMKDNFESRIRLALEYLRNNFDQRIDDIQVEVEVNPAQTSKLIYDTQDKMNDLNKENPDLPEFLKILNLSAKDM